MIAVNYRKLSKLLHEIWAVLLPVLYAKYLYKKILKKRLDLRDPRDYNEKVQWLKIYSDLSQWTELADKYKVREYVKKCGFEDNLVKLYGAWDKVEDIGFDALPDKFVLKPNHAFGSVILVKDKSKLKIEETKKTLETWKKSRYGLQSFEPHYWNIRRKILAEELLIDESSKLLSKSLIDYKFWCIHGEPFIIMVLYNRENTVVGSDESKNDSGMQIGVYDLEWNLRLDYYQGNYANHVESAMPKPYCFNEMIHICRTLSKPFIQVRVDLYEVNNRVFFGELTFTPGGSMSYFSEDVFLRMGEKMDLSQAKRRTKPFII
jgi:hypothetical protein